MECTCIPCERDATHVVTLLLTFNEKPILMHYPYCSEDIDYFSDTLRSKGETVVTQLPWVDSGHLVC